MDFIWRLRDCSRNAQVPNATFNSTRFLAGNEIQSKGNQALSMHLHALQTDLILLPNLHFVFP